MDHSNGITPYTVQRDYEVTHIGGSSDLPESDSAEENAAGSGSSLAATKDFYNSVYKHGNYFHYQDWLYEPYVKCLIRAADLSPGSSVLDVGCGQGLFSYLFAKNGMHVLGIDLSEIGVQQARGLYQHEDLRFASADALQATFEQHFDCVFVRSCSLYNTQSFPRQSNPTPKLLRHLSKGGVFIFVYNSVISPKINEKWRNHSLSDVKSHFEDFPSSRTFFLSKYLIYGMRQVAFTGFGTACSVALSKMCGLGGDMICLLQI